MTENEPEPSSKSFDELLRDINHDIERKFAFIDGYGAALADCRDETVDIAGMSHEEFRDHVQSTWNELEDRGG